MLNLIRRKTSRHRRQPTDEPGGIAEPGGSWTISVTTGGGSSPALPRCRHCPRQRSLPATMNMMATVPAAAGEYLLGIEVRDRRTRLGLSVRALARHAGVSPAYITAIETARNPSTGRPPVPS